MYVHLLYSGFCVHQGGRIWTGGILKLPGSGIFGFHMLVLALVETRRICVTVTDSELEP